jgi:hypothetical protein
VTRFRLMLLASSAVFAATAGAALFFFQPSEDSRVDTIIRPGAAGPVGFGQGSDDAASSAASAELPPVLEPAFGSRIDASRIPITTHDPDSALARWQRGEWDGRFDGILPRKEIEALRDASARLEPDTSLRLMASVGRAPTPGAGFDVIDFNESGGSVPPDFAVAAGADHLIAVTNVAVEILDKSGTTVFGPSSGASFFTGVPSCTSGLYDPDVLYDEEHGRYLIGFDQGAFSSTGGYCLAVSETSDPTGTWIRYFFQVNTTSDWLDFPHMGIGDDYVVFGGNMFTYPDPMTGAVSFNGSRMWALPKVDLYAGDPVSAVQESVPGGHSTPQPLNLHGWTQGTWPNHGNVVYVLAEVYDGRNYPVYRWDVLAGTVTLAGNADLGSASFPVPVPQSGEFSIEGNDWRPHGFDYRNGYAWTANTIACNPGGGTVNCVRWAQVDITSGALGPQGSGIISSSGDYRTFPAVVANACDDMAIGYTLKSSASHPGAAVSGRLSTDPAGTVGSEVVTRAGEIVYTAFDINVPQGDDTYRWGDYTGMAIDPDGVTFWALGQYSKNTGTSAGRWGGYAVPLAFPSCTSDVIFADGFENGDPDAWSSATS